MILCLFWPINADTLSNTCVKWWWVSQNEPVPATGGKPCKMLICCVEKWQGQGIRNILSVSQMGFFCLFVSMCQYSDKKIVSTVEGGDAHSGGEVGRGSYTDRFERMQKIEEGQRASVSFLKIYRLYCLVNCV